MERLFFLPVNWVLLVLVVVTLLVGELAGLAGAGLSVPNVEIESLSRCWYCGGGSIAASMVRSIATGAGGEAVSNLNR